MDETSSILPVVSYNKEDRDEFILDNFSVWWDTFESSAFRYKNPKNEKPKEIGEE